jgi:hypothetical protein
MANWRQREIQKVALSAAARSQDPTRHKVFFSYHVDDADEVEEFIDEFGHVCIPTVVGVTSEDDFVDSDDLDYIMLRIREKYLADTTVTVVLVGQCTWARKFVDWEIYASLRQYTSYKRSGLMAITLSSISNLSGRTPPARVSDNVLGVDGDEGYARWWKYPSSADKLQEYIDIAFGYRSERAHLIDNSRSRRQKNAEC